MGTRHLISVVLDGEYKIAQYGQWDGYPSGQGQAIVDFLLDNFDREAFKRQLAKCRFLDREGKDKAFVESYSANAPEWSSEPDKRTDEQKRWWKTYMSRDLGASILKAVAESQDDEILLDDHSSFAGESLFCEWAYVIDLDKDVLEVYEGFQKQSVPAGERFAEMKPRDGDYYQVKHLKTFPIAELTAESMDGLERSEDEDEE